MTSLITVFGKQFRDWTADYDLYAKDRVDEAAIFRQVRKQVEVLGQGERPLCVALDDTILRKTGKTIPGAAYRKDPLSPAFNVNLVWAQRMLQLSATVVDDQHDVRLVPLAFKDASTPRKPRKTAPPETVRAYREQMKQRNLNAIAVETLATLQQERTQENQGTTPALRVVVDGSYPNKKMLRHLPANTTLIGRIRKDARLSAKPAVQEPRGRKRVYGEDLPTPEQIRQDPAIPWVKVEARVDGKRREFEVKTLAPIRWRAAGAQDLRVVVIRPVGYFLKKRSQKILHPTRLPDLHRPGPVPGRGDPAIRLALGHRSEPPRRKNHPRGGPSPGAQRPLGRKHPRHRSGRLRHAAPGRDPSLRPRRQTRRHPGGEVATSRQKDPALDPGPDQRTAPGTLGESHPA